MLEISKLYQRYGDRVAVDKLRAVGIYRPLGGSIT
jgi:hypothetical protein